MGQPADATHGIQVLMGLTDAALGQYPAFGPRTARRGATSRSSGDIERLVAP